MIVRKPAYFDQFRCLAGECPDSCCQEWSVTVDSQAAAFYRKLPGSLGDRLRQVLADQDGQTVMLIENRRCPMWRTDGLCRIQAELGHDALCVTCREFPRLCHDYGSFRELMLELSCPEATRLILSGTPPVYTEATCEGSEEPDYDPRDMALLLQTRQEALALLWDPTRPVNESLALVLMYTAHAQAMLDGLEVPPFVPETAMATARHFAAEPDFDGFLTFFRQLEILTPRWEAMLTHPSPVPWQETLRSLADYGIRRYWLQAVSDLDLIGRGKLIVASCILVTLLGGTLPSTAQLYSKEIENDPDNVDAILDAAYAHTAFTDDKFLGFLLKHLNIS